MLLQRCGAAGDAERYAAGCIPARDKNMTWKSLVKEHMEQRIYRVFRLGRFLELLDLKRNTLVRPALWEDPWEEWWAHFLRKEAGISVPADVFGQCWTAVEESDVMWRVYAPLCDGVKIATAYGVLLESLSSSVMSKCAMEVATVVPVEYKTDAELREYGHKLISDFKKSEERGVNAVPEKMLRILKAFSMNLRYQNKRTAFEWEQEFRVLAMCPEQTAADTLSYPIDVNKVVHEIVFDPRMDKTLCTMIEEHIRRVGLACPVYQSRLYSLDL